MNIGSQSIGNAFGADPVSRPEMAATSAPAARAAQQESAPTDRVQLPPTREGAGGFGNVQERLQSAAQKIDARLAFLMQDADLDDTQMAALKGAKGEFTGILDRLENAVAAGSLEDMGTVTKGFQFALEGLRSGVHAVLGEATESTSRTGNAAVAAAGPQPAARPDQASGATPTPAERLSSVEESIGSRLANLVRSGDLEGEQVAALARAQQQFTSTLARLENAIEGGSIARETVAAGFQFAMQGLRSDVNAVLGPKPAGNESAVAAQGLSPEQRLASVQQSVDERLLSLQDSGALGAVSSEALMGAKEQFDATLERLHSAFFDQGGLPRETLSAGLTHALEQLKSDVHGLLQAAATDDKVAIYKPDLGLDPLDGGLESTGFETTV